MVVVVIVRVQHGERQPFEFRQPFEMRKIFPQQRAPANVIIAVPVAAADGVGAELQKPHDDRYREETEYKIDRPGRLLGLKILPPGWFRRGWNTSGRGVLLDDLVHSKGWKFYKIGQRIKGKSSTNAGI